MTTESTFPTCGPDRWARVTLAEQARAFAALGRITELNPGLPAAYITLSYVVPDAIEVQAQSFAAMEAWREALGVVPGEVEPGNCAPERHHVQFETSVDGVSVRVYVMGDLVAQVAA